MYSNNDKKSNVYGADREKAPGGGPVIHKDPSKRDVYTGSNPRMYEPYRRPATGMRNTNTQSGFSGSRKGY